ncbi:MAG: RluA family pseudouridine synthase [Clostridia bacterium]|nr:RluA family pseudouridine synthase [Clostridia bacterium]
MRSIVITEETSNKKIDKAIKELFPRMPASAMYKAFRKKDVKVNGVRVKDDYIVLLGDRLELYITDDILDGKGFSLNSGFSIVYEDVNLLIVNKEQGIPVHPDKDQVSNTLIDLVQAYLKEKGEYSPHKSDSFPPSLCHRLDRNTGGLLIIAKNEKSLKVMLDKIKSKEVKKYYQCLVSGRMQKQEEELKAYLTKDERKSRVFIDDKRTRDSLEIVTRYRVLSYENNISKLEIELVTGRTHQIRAHLAHIGHPIIGDGKYGTNAINRPLKAKFQALWAYKLKFSFCSDAGILNYLKGKTFEVKPTFKI